jgi:hypothetical protein
MEEQRRSAKKFEIDNLQNQQGGWFPYQLFFGFSSPNEIIDQLASKVNLRFQLNEEFVSKLNLPKLDKTISENTYYYNEHLTSNEIYQIGEYVKEAFSSQHIKSFVDDHLMEYALIVNEKHKDVASTCRKYGNAVIAGSCLSVGVPSAFFIKSKALFRMNVFAAFAASSALVYISNLKSQPKSTA